MKKILVFVLMLILVFSMIGCKNKGKTDNGQSTDNGTVEQVVEDVTQYVRHSSIICYVNEADLGKKANEVSADAKKYLYFGNDVQVVKSKLIDKKTYYQIQLPDGSNCWSEKDDLAKKFIIINKKDFSLNKNHNVCVYI